MDALVRSLAVTGSRGVANATSLGRWNATLLSSGPTAQLENWTISASATAPVSLDNSTVSGSVSVPISWGNSTISASASMPTSFGNSTISASASMPTSFGNSTISAPASIITTPTGTINNSQWANATECWSSYWSYTQATWDYLRSNVDINLVTKTGSYLASVITPTTVNGNVSYTVLCDGVPRFKNPDDSYSAYVPITYATPVTVTWSTVTPSYTWHSGSFGPEPTCSIQDQRECNGIWSMFGSSLSNRLETWSTSNVLTVSLASPATAIVVNDITTPLPTPVITLHNETYTGVHDTYSISGALNLYGETYLTPGAQSVLTWNYNQITSKPFGPRVTNCARPSGQIIDSRCSTAQCTIGALHVELLYFPPPSSSRDLCANTSPGFNSYSVSHYSYPHSSTVLNSTTFWSDKAYVRYTSVSAYKWCDLDDMLGRTRVPVGGTYTTNLVEVSSADVSSICNWRYAEGVHLEVIGATAKPLNFADLSGPVPKSAYDCIQRCARVDGIGRCDEIISDYHRPALAVPTQVRDLDPEWASCLPYFEGVPDPPIALQTRTAPFGTTTTGDAPVKTDPPLPGDNIPSVGPPLTLAPDPVPDPPVSVPWTSTIPLPTAQPQSQPHTNNNPAPNNPRPNPVPVPSPNPNNPTNNRPNPIDNTQARPQPQPTIITTIGGRPIVADPSTPGTIIIPDPNNPRTTQTLTPGGQPVVISGTTLSVSPKGSLVMSGQLNLVPITTVGGQPVFLNPSRPGILLVGNPADPAAPMKTLSANGNTAVVLGTTISLAIPTGSAQTSAITSTTTAINGLQLSILPDGSLRISDPSGAEQTLKPGDPQVSVNGHSIFIDAGGNVLVDGQKVDISNSGGSLAGGELIVVGPDGTTTTIDIPTVTDAARIAEMLVAAANAVATMSLNRASKTMDGGETRSSGDTAESVISNSITGGGGASREDAGQATSTSNTKSGATRIGCERWIYVALLIMIIGMGIR